MAAHAGNCDEQQPCSEVVTLRANMATVLHDLYGNAKPGFIQEARDFFEESRAERSIRYAKEEAEAKKRWKRSDKIAVAAILAVVLLPPAAWVVPHTISFFKDLYGMAQEYEKLHKSELHPPTASQLVTAHRDTAPALAGETRNRPWQ